MWRIAYSVVSALTLVVTFAGTVAADSHLATGTTGGGATTTVTTVPTTGIGLMSDQGTSVVALGLLGVAALFAMMAAASWRQQQV